MIMVYGFFEVGVGFLAKGRRRGKRVRDATFYAVTVPAMAGLYGAFAEAVITGREFPAAVFFTGCVVLSAGIILRLAALVQLGTGFSTKVEKSEGQRLTTTGMYRLVRHPLYLATLLQVAGSGIMLCSVVALALFPLCVAGVLVRIRKEERFMMVEFPEYGLYMKKTRRLIPWLY
ncbi:MAG TPA: isoprenylcysteine carboxylmethyltransferase family protein [Chitinivibrionales bacterium]|jgi:protein-S-isoprenylcysteine O-methyltransferase Ste14|nr:isoprenylcysteine carboxylmethyltransferase family protein [Chitinivibrionales bacterium]